MTTEIIDVEAEEMTPLPATASSEAPGAAVALFGTTDPVEVLAAATRVAEALTGILEERQLYKVIRNRKHIYIQGWLMLAGMLQVATPNVWVRELTEGNKRVGWEARYEARAADGRLLSSAEGECRITETNIDKSTGERVPSQWAKADDHALRSMAQTRAQSKALSSALRWVVELGGFAGTPAEEMPTNGGTRSEEAPRLKCPSCGQQSVVDNREAKAGDPSKDRWPAFGCRNDDCKGGKGNKTWATWDPDFYTDPSITAKQKVLALVEANPDGFDARYPDVDTGSNAEAAGHLWNAILGDFEDRSQHTLRIVVMASEMALADSDRDLKEIWDNAEEIVFAEDADAAVGTSDYH